MATTWSYKSFEYDLEDNGSSVGWLPGEQYDVLTGKMNHSMVDLRYPGNGIPIVVTRSFQQSDGIDSFQSGYGYKQIRMKVDVPALTIPVKNISAKVLQCAEWNAVDKPLTFRVNGSKIDFFQNMKLREIPFPNDALYISKDAWMIKCSSGGDYEIYSPNGYIYKTGDVFRQGGHEIRTINKVTDNFGNELHYTYSGYVPPREVREGWSAGREGRIWKISSTDGREVTFKWTIHKNDASGGGNVSGYSLDRIYSNGSPNKHNVKYSYGTNQMKVTYGDPNSHEKREIEYFFDDINGSNSDNRIKSIKIPEGGKIVYQYGDYSVVNNFHRDNGNSLGPLIKRTVESRSGEKAIWNFKMENLASISDAFSRVIVGPFNTVEYWQKKSNLSRGDSPATLITAEDGKIIRIKKYKNRINHWDEYSKPDVLIDYEYEKLFSIHPSNIGTKVSLVERNISVNDGSSTTKFRAKYYYELYGVYDPFYDVRKIVEYNAKEVRRSATYTYKHNEFDGKWILSKLDTVVYTGGDKTSYEYYSDGSIETEIKNGIVTSYTYDSHGNVNKVTTDGETYEYSDYFRGIAKKEIDQEGRVRGKLVNDDGTIFRETVLGGSEYWQYEYDSLSRVKTISYPNQFRKNTNIMWVSPNLEMEYFDDGSFHIERHYNDFGQLIFEERKSNYPSSSTQYRSIKYEYDLVGRLLFQSYPIDAGFSLMNETLIFRGTEYTYDGFGRLVKEKAELKNKQTREKVIRYDSSDSGNLKIKVTDGRGKSTLVSFESYGGPSYQNIVKHVDANNVVTDYFLDYMGRVTESKRDGKSRRYYYNSKKQINREINPESGEITYAYYPDGMLKLVNNNGQYIRYDYFKDNRMQRQKYYTSGSEEWVQRNFLYNSNGYLEQSINKSSDGSQNNSIEYEYDSEGNVLVERHNIDNKKTFVIGYEYDSRNNLSAMRLPTGNRYTLQPNGFGQPTQTVGDDGKSIFELIRYRASGAYSILRNNGTESVGYADYAYRVTGRGYRPVGTGSSGFKAKYTYSYDTESNMTRIVDSVSGASQNMFYDNANRLTDVSGSLSGNWKYQYDNSDNIRSINDADSVNRIFSYNSKNQLLSVTSSQPTRTFDYDVRGNLTRMHSYKHNDPQSLDDLGITRNIADQIVGTSDGTKYSYNAKGHRVYKERNGRDYSVYDHMGKLRYRISPEAGVESEYFYVSGELVAKRDYATDGAGADDNGDSEQITHGIVVEGLTITMPNDGWYQVQSEDGSQTYCEGIRSCIMPAVGIYKVINHTAVITHYISVTDGASTLANGITDASVLSFTPTTAELYWSSASDQRHGGLAVEYEIYRNGDFLVTTTNGSSYVIDSGLTAGQTYQFQLIAVYSNGAKSDKTQPVSLVMPEQVLLANAPSEFSAKAFSGTAAEFYWQPVSDNGHGGSPKEYVIYKNGVQHTITTNSKSFWMDSGLTSGVTYEFEIEAIYNDGAKSGRVGPISLKMESGQTAGAELPVTGNDDYSLSGNEMTFKTNNWYQIQNSTDYSTIWQNNGNNGPVTVPNGTYNIINHSTGQRYDNVQIPQ